MQIFHTDKIIQLKIVYYGAGLCGKTTNLRQIFSRLKPEEKMSQDLYEVPTKTDKTLYFETLPIAQGKVGAFETKIDFYTVPGQTHYEASRKMILDDVDGVVFVADSQSSVRDENIAALKELKDFLEVMKPGEKVPILLQFNKRDAPDAMPIKEMSSDLQVGTDAPWFEASAINGDGVMETMQTIVRMTKATIRNR